MKISILVPNLASNGIAGAWIVATLLGRHHEVEVIGRLRGDESPFPLADYPWVEIRAEGFAEAMRAMERKITGDLVVAYGVSMTSFSVGLLTKLRRRVPLVLHMPEWEVHDHYKRKHPLSRAAMILRSLVGEGWADPHSFKYRYILDHLTGFADERLVCCRFLQQRYGGVLFPQGTDTEQFDPARFDKMAIRRKWGIPEDATILFFGGNPQPNKGVDVTIAALNALGSDVNARLVIVGRDATHPYTKKMLDLAHGKAIALGSQPFHLMPELLATADIVALPQVKDPKSYGYVPCKIYEAMAMEIPVISSDLCDIPEILQGCGYVVPAGDDGALQAQIEHVLTHPEEAHEMGRQARQRIIDRYSWDVMDQILQDVIRSVTTRAPLTSASKASPRPQNLSI